MAARRYEISLRVLKNIYINTNEMPNHFTLTFFFAAKGMMYHVAIATVIFSHVKISCFHVFPWTGGQCFVHHYIFHIRADTMTKLFDFS